MLPLLGDFIAKDDVLPLWRFPYLYAQKNVEKECSSNMFLKIPPKGKFQGIVKPFVKTMKVRYL